MRWIADEDKARLEKAYLLAAGGAGMSAADHIRTVLSNMRRLECEQPTQQPQVRTLSDAERRAIYPERYR